MNSLIWLNTEDSAQFKVEFDLLPKTSDHKQHEVFLGKIIVNLYTESNQRHKKMLEKLTDSSL